jgi:hypothetical protein
MPGGDPPRDERGRGGDNNTEPKNPDPNPPSLLLLLCLCDWVSHFPSIVSHSSSSSSSMTTSLSWPCTGNATTSALLRLSWSPNGAPSFPSGDPGEGEGGTVPATPANCHQRRPSLALLLLLLPSLSQPATLPPHGRPMIDNAASATGGIDQ